MPSLTPRHLGRYRSLATLLLKHLRTEGIRPTGDLVDDGNGGGASHRRAPTEDAEQLVADLERMGPTFIKLGQLLSTRSDLLAPAYIDALSRLQDDVEPFPYEHIESTVERELGVRLSKGFEWFDHAPLATASLGQVHQARLRSGQAVAVKVQRPGVRQQVLDDLEVIEELAAFVDDHTRTGRRFGFSDMVAEFRASLMVELDYRREASHLRTLGENLSHPLLVVPQPIDDYTTATVLTMEYIDGRNVASLGPLALQEVDGRRLADALFRSYLQQILQHGFVHADPHPGNVLLTGDGRLALIDLGMVTRVSPSMQDSLVRMLLGVADDKADIVAEILTDLGTKLDHFDADTFRRGITHLLQEHHDTSIGDLQAGSVVGHLCRIAGESGLRPPPELTMVAKALLNLDQVGRRLDPEFQPAVAMQDEVASIMRRKLMAAATPSAVLSSAMEAKEFVEELPRRVNKVLNALAEGKLTINVEGIDERELMRGIQKLANRVATALVVAALLLGAAMVMRIETDAELFGYPPLAIVLFVVAALAAIGLVVSSFLSDLPQQRRRRRS